MLERLRDCWASFFSERALFYREQRGSLDDLGMAVVVQRMVSADVAGVLFTMDPVQRRRDRMVVEAVFGLGEAVVSGQVTPDHFVLARDGTVKRERLAVQPLAVVSASAAAPSSASSRRRRAAPRRSARTSCTSWPGSAPSSRSGSAARRTSSGRSRTASCTCSSAGR